MTRAEMSVPAIAVPRPDATLADLVATNAREAPDAVLFQRRGPQGWEDVTCADFAADVAGLARGFVAAGVGVGDRVAVMSKTRYEWTLVDFALWTAGAVPVPIYETSAPDQVAWILSDSQAVGCVVETPEHAACVAGVREQAPALAQVWCLDDGALARLRTAGEDVEESVLRQRLEGCSGGDVATIIYTSGTTGRPKGCELTHANFGELTANTVGSLGDIVCAPGAATLIFLPLAHVFARFIEVLCVRARVRTGFTSDVSTLLDDLAGFRPTFVLAVPRVFEKIYNSSEARAQASGRSSVFRAAADTAVAYSRSLDAGGPSPLLRVRHAVLDRLVYRRLRAAMGGRVQYAVSGGAPLSERLCHFFRGAGLTVLEGWGLTETTAPCTVNTPALQRIGTVGPPLPGVRVRVAEDGELLVGGVGLLRGYHGAAEATAEVIRDGWFHTGDLGQIDDDGCVRITGRKKDILVTAGGKNVAASVLEDRLRQHPLISQAVVVGDQRPFVGALLTLDAELLPGWLSAAGLPAMDVPAAAASPVVRAELQRAVDATNATVSKAESIRRFAVLTTDLTEASGHLTPKLSLKRRVVLADFADEIDALYG